MWWRKMARSKMIQMKELERLENVITQLRVYYGIKIETDSIKLQYSARILEKYYYMEQRPGRHVITERSVNYKQLR
jgi:hypothetical protein